MSTPNKKPVVAPGRRTPTTSQPGGTPSKMATPGITPAATTTNGVNRTRSIRAPARAAAARKQTPDPAEDDAKAEMQARMDELQQKLQQAELSHEESQKHGAVLQVRLDEALKEQGILEESVHEHTERINDLENDKKESLRARREMEQIYESERAAAMKEKEDALAREEEMQQSMQRLKETLAQREMRAGLEDDRRPISSRQSSHGRSNNPSPSPDTPERQFAPPSIQRSDSSSRSNSKLVMQKDKIIEQLRLDLADVQIKLVEMENMGGGRMQELQRQMYEIKMQNARLMEENESFQLLLSEKTLNGDFLRPPSDRGSRPPSRNPDAPDIGTGGGTSLADELDSQADSEGGEEPRRLQAEVNSLKDQNKALTLYINNIISRLLQHEQFEAILDKTPDLMAGPGAASRKYHEVDTDKELPPPPPEKDAQPSGLLERAKSVLGGKARPRPLSQQVNPEHVEPPLRTPKLGELSKHEDPDTAPSVPIGRSSSLRTNHRRANSEWPAATVVTNMYRGPQQSGMTGPLSPGLTSPTGRNSFFGGMRAPSGGSNVPTISENTTEKENAVPQRDSKMSVPSSSHSNRNSVSSNPAHADNLDMMQDTGAGGLTAERSNPSSPPRSTASSGEKDAKQSGAVMMGSKPRPLRLVQEAADEDAAKKQANRASWFGWMNKGGVPPGSPIVGTHRSNPADAPTQ